MNKQDIAVHIKDEEMLNEAREILESVGEVIHAPTFRLTQCSNISNFLYYSNYDKNWGLGWQPNQTEITLTQLKEILNK